MALSMHSGESTYPSALSNHLPRGGWIWGTGSSCEQRRYSETPRPSVSLDCGMGVGLRLGCKDFLSGTGVTLGVDGAPRHLVGSVTHAPQNREQHQGTAGFGPPLQDQGLRGHHEEGVGGEQNSEHFLEKDCFQLKGGY